MARRVRLVSVLPLLVMFTVATVVSVQAARSAGFEPNATTLACMRGPWKGMSMESGGNYANNSNPKYKGAYQSDRAFEVRHALNKIPAAHWHLWGSHTWDRADKWHPMIQDEMARNGIRERGLSPWPKPNRVCPR